MWTGVSGFCVAAYRDVGLGEDSGMHACKLVQLALSKVRVSIEPPKRVIRVYSI